ncbi:hypothetical protein RMATCC62417_18444 [Rhizopus microsporus]|nr:hypothetical protein RMATCC62417_18444 [Rhizopus microsporus]
MRRDILNDELDQLTHSYDYGIVPGSATVFVKDELNNLARMDLTLLENIIVVIEISEQGYKILSCSPLLTTVDASSLRLVQKNMQVPFETMDNLLMTISPLFRQKFQKILDESLNHVHNNNKIPSFHKDLNEWIH